MKSPLTYYRELSPENRRMLKTQLAAIFVVITLLNLGFYWQREFHELALRRNLQSVMRAWDGAAWYVWMPVAPVTLLLIRRYPFQREHALRSVLRLFAGSAIIYFALTNTRYLLRILPNIWQPDSQDLPVSWPNYVQTQLERTPLDFLTYCGLFSMSLAIYYYSSYRQRADEILRLEVQTSQLQADLARLELTVLRSQFHPHFLFNSFNSISTLVRQQKNSQAVEVIAQLSDLLRLVMENIETQETPLEREIHFVRSYLEMERIRFGEKLMIAISVDPPALECTIPSLLLQPLVENAIKHGLSRRTEPGWLRVDASLDNNRLRIEVTDDGPQVALASAPHKSFGLGLRNTHARLEQIYGQDYEFEMVARAQGGVTVRIDLPVRTAAASPQPAKALSA